MHKDLSPQQLVWLRQAEQARGITRQPWTPRLVEKVERFPCAAGDCEEMVTVPNAYCLDCRLESRDRAYRRAKSRKTA